MSAQKELTIYDIAREAGVSASTVSRILSDSPGVRPEKRERVRAIIEKHNFRPNALARGLSETHSKLITMLCPDVRNAYYANLFLECERAAFERGYTLVLNSTFTQEALEIAFLNKSVGQRAECVVVCGGLVDWLPIPEKYLAALESVSERIPLVVAGNADIKNCYQIYIDQNAAMRLALRHLSALGHRNIAFLHGYSHIYQTQEKLKAFGEGMAAEGLKVNEEFVLDAGEFSEAAGFSAMNRILSLSKLPTAVIAINDMVAAGALQAILRLGYSCPEDFSLVGFDDSHITDLTRPHITSVHYDYRAYGKAIIDTAMAAIQNQECPRRIVIPCSLSIKESCRKIQQ